MHLNARRTYKYCLIAALGGLTTLSLLASPVLFIDIEYFEIKHTGSTQLSWPDASTACSMLNEQWSLPSIYQLGAIYYRRNDIELLDKTDYWSHNSIAGFAFGLNTGSGIASFDRHADTDHFLCIRPL